ncbi:PilZ domain-containing protein [Shewanella woodyi]|uniref:Type IV pilus assembly PilZ n=1 Tax=Shewanella woodyi (strain ATCC 51908 / MS32) TaxID=392500 RepID=B1KNH7_SHEWM|nr:PilZ domain-containing protein [Shewanella woodyi]ACA86054.1 type IV pilus assembly PilZ [Shewanella woodyi ATCC 51908]
MEESEDRRHSLRLDMESDKIEVSWQGEDQQLQSTDATCVDLARHGVLFEHQNSFKLGELIEISFNPDNDKRHTVKGQVCRCKNVGEFFHTAVQLVPSY